MAAITKTQKPPEMSRVERKKARTRARIVEAAERLMRQHGVEAVTIQDITEAADIGHGTFYLYFKTKDQVLRPLIERLSEDVHAEVDRAAAGSRDPAERMALGLRILLRTIAEDPLWGWYASCSGTPFSRLVADMGAPPAEDMERGMETGRFHFSNFQATSSFIDGALVGVVRSLTAGTQVEEIADNTAELVLRVLGLDAEEARRIVRRPLDLDEARSQVSQRRARRPDVSSP